ncbi:hypothetical protein V6N12_002171 [Hibiscus sabdariffa]|uniref:Reverse transcriptase Ty1/copia-type domain-containing protein n=1 Tax=Hibiscus sabdariffa TaxID=183260 RepID=A0ABR2BIC8_9ROSI
MFMAQSIGKPPFFNGEHYAYRKNRMMLFIKAKGFHLWGIVEPPEGIKSIGCKWVFKRKTDMDDNVQTYKGRLVAKGFRQIHGIDYDETFSPIAMFKSIRILLAIAAFHDYEI